MPHQFDELFSVPDFETSFIELLQMCAVVLGGYRGASRKTSCSYDNRASRKRCIKVRMRKDIGSQHIDLATDVIPTAQI